MFPFLYTTLGVFFELASVPIAILFSALSHYIIPCLVNVYANTVLAIFDLELIDFCLLFVLLVLFFVLQVALVLFPKFSGSLLLLHLSQHRFGPNDLPVDVVDDLRRVKVVFRPHLVLLILFVIILKFVCELGTVLRQCLLPGLVFPFTEPLLKVDFVVNEAVCVEFGWWPILSRVAVVAIEAPLLEQSISL